MAVSLTIARNDLRRRLRDRSLLITAFVAPFVLAMIIDVAFRGAGDFSATIGVVDADRGAASQGFVLGLLEAPDDERGGVTFVAVASPDQARGEVDSGDLGAAIVVPAGFTAGLTGVAPPPELEVLQAPDKRISGEVAQAVAGQYAATVGATRLAVATAATASGGQPSPEQLGRWVASASVLAPAVELDRTGMGREEVSLTAYFAASMGIVFLFLGVGAGARSLLTEKREGTLVRLLAAPIPSGSVMVGKAVATMVVGVAGFGVLWAATTLLGAWWGRPLPVAAVILATVLAIAGITTLVAGFARTEAAADGAATTLTFFFALLGGNFITPGALPLLLERLSLLTPNGWALRAFTDLSADGAGLAEVWPSIVVLVVIGLVCGAIGYGRLRTVATR